MKSPECSFEKEVMMAAKLHQWTDSLRAHAAACPVCRETMRVALLMHAYASEQLPHSLPGYRLIWLKAQYVRKQEKLSKVDIVALLGMSVVGVAGFVGLFVWRFPQLFSGVVDSVAKSLFDFRNVMSDGAPLAVIVGVLVMVWALMRDSFFAER